MDKKSRMVPNYDPASLKQGIVRSRKNIKRIERTIDQAKKDIDRLEAGIKDMENGIEKEKGTIKAYQELLIKTSVNG